MKPVVLISKFGQKIEIVGDLVKPIGKIEPRNLLIALARHNPDIDFWIMTRNDLSLLGDIKYNELFPNKNAFSLYDHRQAKASKISVNDLTYVETMYNKLLVGKQILGSIIFPGIGIGISVEGNTKKDGSAIQLSDTALYNCASIGAFLNNHSGEFKNIELKTDIRYKLTSGKDLMFDVHKHFAQRSETAIWKKYDSLASKNVIPHQVEYEFMPIYETFMYGLNDIPLIKKQNDFNIVLNEGKANRNAIMLDILNSAVDLNLYGNWKNIDVISNPKFKGAITYSELESIFSKTKMSLVIPSDNDWVSMKHLELLRLNVIPLFYKTCNIQKYYPTLPNTFIINDVNEIHDIIAMVKSEDNFNTLLNTAKSIFFHKDIYNCGLLNDQIMKEFIANYTRPIAKPTKKVFSLTSMI